MQQTDSLTTAYIFAIYFTKLSISLLYIRIFGVQRTFRLFIRGGILFICLFYAVYLCISIASTVQCATVSSQRLPLCKNGAITTIVTSVLNVCTDIYLLILPIRPILDLQLHRRQKVGLLIIFLSGVL